jgi:iron-sulfur cluster insertion protein
MQKVIISHEAYEEFKGFLDENNIDNYSIRINFAGNSCSGPAFNISVDEPVDDDVVEQVNDIKFIAKKELIDEFDGFIISSTDENEGRGLSLKPLSAPEGGCGGCSGCH